MIAFPVRLAVVIFFLAVSWPSVTDACSCAGPALPCDAFWTTDVFVGRVTAIEPIVSKSELRWGIHRVTLDVTERFRGKRSRRVVVLTGGGAGDCGYPFVVGGEYFVYAGQAAESALATSICSRTNQLAKAASDLEYARSARDVVPGTLAQVSGRVAVWDRGHGPSEIHPPGRIVATGSGKTFAAPIDISGGFVLRQLPPGKYTLTPELQDGFEGFPREVAANDPRGCGTTWVWAGYSGRVSGRVVTPAGIPLPGLPIQVVPPSEVDKPDGSSSRIQGLTNEDGSFELRGVPPGTYLFGLSSILRRTGERTFPRAFYPGVLDATAATLISVPSNAPIVLDSFVLPSGIELVQVRGIVRNQEGRPVANARVSVGGFWGQQLTGVDGTFILTLAPGRYGVWAEWYPNLPRTEGAQTGRTSFQAATDATPIVVALRPSPSSQ